jgi:hypothetical protein
MTAENEVLIVTHLSRAEVQNLSSTIASLQINFHNRARWLSEMSTTRAVDGLTIMTESPMWRKDSFPHPYSVCRG